MQSPEIKDDDKRKLLSVLSHASIFVSGLVLSVGIPIALMLISEDPVVKENAKEAVNFHINVWAYGVILGILTFLTFGLLGFILAPIWFLYHWGLAIWGIIHCLNQPNQPFRYPFIYRVI